MMAAKIFMILITTAIAKHHHSNLGPNDDFFASVYVAIHSVVNDLFESIDLGTNFTNQSNTNALLTMHQDLRNIADIAIETYNVIQNITNENYNHDNQSYFINSLNKTEVDVYELDTVVNKILNKKNFDVYRTIKGTIHNRAKGKDKKHDKHESNIKDKETKAKVNPAFEDSKEFTDFVINFLSKVNNLTVHDFEKSDHVYKYGRLMVPSKNNLKAWEAPSSLIFDLEESDQTRRIFRGSKTFVNSFPFVVSIHIMGEFTCSGCIISRDFVITAASCLGIAYKNDFFERNLKSIYVRLISDHTARGGETIPVQNLYFHPEFEPKHLQNNLAILKLEKRVRFSRKQKKIRRILWDKTPGGLSNETKQILILGWGAIKKDQVTQKHPKLRVSILDVYNTSDCKKKYSEEFITKENFCAAYNGTSGSACNGDVGGPGIVGGTLMGVVSFGAPECGMAGAPTVFTKLGYYVPWIENVLNLHKKRNQSNYDSIETRRKNKHSNKKRNKTNKSSNNTLVDHHSDYPEDEQALRDTLIELSNDGQSLIHDVIYGELYDEFIKFFKSSEETDDKMNSISTKNLRTNQPTPTPFFEFKLNFETETEIDEFKRTTQTLPDWTGVSDYETDNDAVQNDYSDNYENSSEEEHGLSIEVPAPSTTKTIKSLRNKEDSHETTWSSNSESKSDPRVSDESSDYSKEIREFFETNRNKKYSNKRRDTVGGSQSILKNGRDKRTKEVLIKHDQFSKHARSVLDEGKSFATKAFFIDFDDKNVQNVYDKPKLKKNKKGSSSYGNNIFGPDKTIAQSFYMQF